jgi:cation transport regulator ChaC
MTRFAVFGYGSLVDPASAARTLGRPAAAPVPARLRGWTRRWSLLRDNLRVEKTFAIDPGGELPPFILGLNIERDPDLEAPGPNGALIEVTEPELERLDLREMRYDRADVTAMVAAADPPFDLIVAYSAKAENHAAEPPPGAVILSAYVRALEAAFDALGAGERDLFGATTEPPPVPVVDGRLVRDRIPAGNPREW